MQGLHSHRHSSSILLFPFFKEMIHLFDLDQGLSRLEWIVYRVACIDIIPMSNRLFPWTLYRCHVQAPISLFVTKRVFQSLSIYCLSNFVQNVIYGHSPFYHYSIYYIIYNTLIYDGPSLILQILKARLNFLITSILIILVHYFLIVVFNSPPESLPSPSYTRFTLLQIILEFLY